MIEDAASDKLLNASAVIEIAPVMIPAKNFVANRKILQQIPTIHDFFPYAFLTLLSFIFSLSLINSDINKFVIKNSIYSANGSPKDPQCVFSLCLRGSFTPYIPLCFYDLTCDCRCCCCFWRS